MIKLTQIDGTEIELNLTGRVKAHFDEPRNYAYFILDEWKTQPYKEYISKHDKVILDIGANVGLFALHVLPYVERIICVEPTQSHNEVFNDLIKPLNTFDDYNQRYKVTLESSALHNYTGTVGYHLEGVNTTMNRVNVGHAGAIEVPCITLFDLCQKYDLTKVDFCKIDIEGSEDLAITVETVKAVNRIINKFSIELHPRTAEVQDHYFHIFAEAGYKVRKVPFNCSIFAFK